MPEWKEAIRERLVGAHLDAISEAEIVEELAQHLDDRYEELRANGFADEEACKRVLTELSDHELLTRGVREIRRQSAHTLEVGTPATRGGYFHGVMHDFKIGFRNLRIKPLFSLTVIGMLALGIAGNAAVFSVFDGLFLNALPFPESERLVDLDETAPKWNLPYVGVSSVDLDAWRKSNSTFESMAFFRGASYNLADHNATERVSGAQVTRDMLDVLRLQPLIGRNFTREEDEPGGAKAALLSYRLWERMFQGDQAVLGRVLKLDEEAYTVIGVLPREALFPDRAELWTALQADPTHNSGYYVNGVGRLKAGVTFEQARADLFRIHKGMISEGHKINELTSPILTPLRDRYLGDFRAVGRVLLGAVGVVLLMVCVNIGALMMVRGAARAREMAVRIAIGASRARIVAQLVSENLVLAAIGGAFGVMIGAAGLRAMVAQMPSSMPQWVRFSLDSRFALFCVAITGVATVLFGVAPAIICSRVDVRAALQDARATGSRGWCTLLGALVIYEVGLALMLSVGAGLLVEAFQKVLHVDPGFRPQNVITFRVSLPDTTYSQPEEKITYYDQLLARLRVSPGVKAAGAASAPPLGGQWGGIFEAEDGRRFSAQGENPEVLKVAATPGYFEAMGMTLLDGRTFEKRDDEPNVPTAVLVNESFLKYFWGTGSPVGKHIRPPGEKDWYQVVGYVRDEKHFGLDQKTRPGVFLPYGKTILTVDRNDARALQEMTVILRASEAPGVVVGAVREVARQLNADVPMYAVQTMTEQLDRSLSVRRAYSWLLSVFAAAALLLAAAGIYGTLSYAVSQRTREIGIRAALGARPGQVLGQVLLGGMTNVSIGIAVGLVGAFWTTRLLRTMLFGVSSYDPAIYTAVVLSVLGAGLLANLMPALRASKIDPMRALRVE